MMLRQLSGALVLLLGSMLMPAWAAEQAPVSQEYTERGLDGCLKCHSEEGSSPVVSVLHTAHFVTGDANAPAELKTCESCHGPSSEHAKKLDDGVQRVAPEINFGPNMAKSSAESRNSVCLGCHENGMVMNWAGSAHDNDDVVCSDCHSSHNSRDPVLNKVSEQDVCYACHKNTQIEANKPHRHPIREGKVACSDCHNPHGTTTEFSLLKPTLNDTCTSCHAEKRGPFLWEHQPVQEDCSSCHTSHGSINERLLKVARPFICQQCHTENSHRSNLFDGGQISITDLDIDNAVSKFGASKGCTNCHSQVHGSNHPAGSRLMR